MTSKHPPRIATWLLKHFGSGPNNDTVLGDLAEQYMHNNNEAWYWRQATKAIPISFFREIREHRGSTAIALLTGWAIWILCALSIPHFVELFFFGEWTAWFSPVIGGGVLAHPLSKWAEYPYVTAFVLEVALPLMVGAMSGWLVARFHRDQKTAVVLLFAGSVLLMNLLSFARFLFGAGTPTVSVFSGPLAINAATAILGILLGGGLFRDHSREVIN
jgi:hypothetical protein